MIIKQLGIRKIIIIIALLLFVTLITLYIKAISFKNLLFPFGSYIIHHELNPEMQLFVEDELNIDIPKSVQIKYFDYEDGLDYSATLIFTVPFSEVQNIIPLIQNKEIEIQLTQKTDVLLFTDYKKFSSIQINCDLIDKYVQEKKYYKLYIGKMDDKRVAYRVIVFYPTEIEFLSEKSLVNVVIVFFQY